MPLKYLLSCCCCFLFAFAFLQCFAPCLLVCAWFPTHFFLVFCAPFAGGFTFFVAAAAFLLLAFVCRFALRCCLARCLSWGGRLLRCGAGLEDEVAGSMWSTSSLFMLSFASGVVSKLPALMSAALDLDLRVLRVFLVSDCGGSSSCSSLVLVVVLVAPLDLAFLPLSGASFLSPLLVEAAARVFFCFEFCLLLAFAFALALAFDSGFGLRPRFLGSFPVTSVSCSWGEMAASLSTAAGVLMAGLVLSTLLSPALGADISCVVLLDSCPDSLHFAVSISPTCSWVGGLWGFSCSFFVSKGAPVCKFAGTARRTGSSGTAACTQDLETGWKRGMDHMIMDLERHATKTKHAVHWCLIS